MPWAIDSFKNTKELQSAGPKRCPSPLFHSVLIRQASPPFHDNVFHHTVNLDVHRPTIYSKRTELVAVVFVCVLWPPGFDKAPKKVHRSDFLFIGRRSSVLELSAVKNGSCLSGCISWSHCVKIVSWFRAVKISQILHERETKSSYWSCSRGGVGGGPNVASQLLFYLENSRHFNIGSLHEIQEFMSLSIDVCTDGSRNASVV